MSPSSQACAKTQRQLRAYALGTLGARAAGRVERHLAACAACRDCLEKERQELAVLDGLEDAEPGRDLTAAVMAKLSVPARGSDKARNRGLTTALVGLAAVCLVAAIILPALSRAREAARRESSQNNLKQIGIALKMYACEKDGLYPPLTPVEGVWMMDLARLYPDYMNDPRVLVNPKLPDAEDVSAELVQALGQDPPDFERATRLAARSYCYLGWIVENQEDIERLVNARETLSATGPDADLVLEGKRFVRFREEIGDAEAAPGLPVAFENLDILDTRKPPGANVLYADGHVGFVRLGQGFPVSEEVREALASPSP